MNFHENLKVQNLLKLAKLFPRRKATVTTATQRDLIQAATHPAARPSAGELLPGALAAEGMIRIERLLQKAARGAPIELRRACEDLVGAGGKRVRPLLTMLSARASRPDRKQAKGRVALALAAELCHSATLLHDDVIDDGLTRRGLPAPRVAYGNGVSVLAGDWMLSSALELALRSKVPGGVEALVRTLRELVSGEGRQLALRGDVSFSSEDALWVAKMKTGALFGFCAEAGGLAARAPKPLCDSLRRFGQACGTAFQISDDLLDFQSDAAAMGKAVLADVAEGKASLPVALALEKNPALRGELRALLSDELKQADMPNMGAPVDELVPARVRTFAAKILRTSALTTARKIAERERDVALAALNEVPPSETRDLLALVAALLLDRSK